MKIKSKSIFRLVEELKKKRNERDNYETLGQEVKKKKIKPVESKMFIDQSSREAIDFRSRSLVVVADGDETEAKSSRAAFDDLNYMVTTLGESQGRVQVDLEPIMRVNRIGIDAATPSTHTHIDDDLDFGHFNLVFSLNDEEFYNLPFVNFDRPDTGFVVKRINESLV